MSRLPPVEVPGCGELVPPPGASPVRSVLDNAGAYLHHRQYKRSTTSTANKLFVTRPIIREENGTRDARTSGAPGASHPSAQPPLAGSSATTLPHQQPTGKAVVVPVG